jgi:hypothetical protein
MCLRGWPPRNLSFLNRIALQDLSWKANHPGSGLDRLGSHGGNVYRHGPLFADKIAIHLAAPHFQLERTLNPGQIRPLHSGIESNG